MTKYLIVLLIVATVATVVTSCKFHDEMRRREREKQLKIYRQRESDKLNAARHASRTSDYRVGRTRVSQVVPSRGHHQNIAAPIVTARRFKPKNDRYNGGGRIYGPNSCEYTGCNQGWTCTYVLGKYRCVRSRRFYPGHYVPQVAHSVRCGAGFEKVNSTTGESCEDIDECASSDTNFCKQTCTNIRGSYMCSCRKGYDKIGRYECTDRDECTPRYYHKMFTSNLCSHTCVNTDGGYTCECPTGYRFKPESEQICIDIDECAEDSPCSSNEKCLNLHGGSSCIAPTACEEGYHRVAINGTTDEFGNCLLEGVGSSLRPNSIMTNYIALYRKNRGAEVGRIAVATQRDYTYTYYGYIKGGINRNFRLSGPVYTNSIATYKITANQDLSGNYTLTVIMEAHHEYGIMTSEIIFKYYVSEYFQYA